MKDFKPRNSYGDRKSSGGFRDRNSGGFSNERRGGGSFDRRDSRDSGGRDFNRGGGFGPAKYKAVCAECGNSCEVPFKPTGNRPVYCSNCFKGKKGDQPGQSNDRNNERSFAKPGFNNHNASKPFSSPSGGSSPEQFEKLNQKLDKILDILDSLSVEEEAEEEFEDREEMDDQEEPAKLMMAEKPKKSAAASKKATGKKGKKK